MHEVLRRRGRDRDQAAEIHQQAAVAVEHDDAPVRPPERNAEPMRGAEPHRADREVVERARIEVVPLDRAAVGGDHHLFGDVALEDLEAFVAVHHDGLRPTRNATGDDFGIGLVDRGLDLGHVGILADEMMRDAHGVADRLDDAHAVAAGVGRQPLRLVAEQADHHDDRLLVLDRHRRGSR